MAWLVREGGDVLASVEVARKLRERTTGLLRRDPGSVTGALVIRHCRQIHTLGIRFPIDVAFCDREGVVLRTVTVPPWRVPPGVRRTKAVAEAERGEHLRLPLWGAHTRDGSERSHPARA